MKIEDYLQEQGVLVYRNVGDSMLPLLRQGKDTFVIRKKESGRCRKYDVVLFRQSGDRYVLHRIVKVREHDYITLGDNSLIPEVGVKDSDILGVMTELNRGGKSIPVEDPFYRFYARAIVALYPVRKICRNGKRKIVKIVKAVFKK